MVKPLIRIFVFKISLDNLKWNEALYVNMLSCEFSYNKFFAVNRSSTKTVKTTHPISKIDCFIRLINCYLR